MNLLIQVDINGSVASCKHITCVNCASAVSEPVNALQPVLVCSITQVCDKGNLRQAMRRGLLHKRTANKGLVVDMRLLVTVSSQVLTLHVYLF